MTTNKRKTSLSATRPASQATRVVDERVRPARTPMDGFRDKLSVRGKDPSYEYRFVKDSSDDLTGKDGETSFRPGQRILRFKEAGWQFVEKDEVSVGDNDIYKTENLGSIVRIPAGQDEYLFLMKIHKDWYNEDQIAKSDRILDAEKQAQMVPLEDGMYGSVSIEQR